jgi:sugar/nucleoside kinase (ribokinase family)
MSDARKKYDVYGMGNALVDLVCKVDEDFLKRMGIAKGLMTLIDRDLHDRLVAELEVETREGGGSAANTMVALSHLGGRGFYSCRVADDEAGRFYLDDLIREGLDTNLKKDSLPSGVTGKCMVMVTPDADRTMNTFLGATELFSKADLEENALAASEWLYIEGYFVAQKPAQAAAVAAVEHARKHGVKISLTFSDPTMIAHFRAGMDEIVGEGVDLILCNEDEAKSYAGKDDLAAAAEKMKGIASTFAITRGARGTLVYDGKKLTEVPGVKVKAIDTVGAGDMFAGAFLYGITHGFTYEDAARLANIAASRVVTKYGPRLTKDELQGILSEFNG